MEVTVIESTDGFTRVAIHGHLDVAGVGAATIVFDRDVVTRRHPTIVDLSDVAFIASLGMGLLVAAAKALHRHGAQLVLLAPQALVADSLRTAGLDGVLPIANDEETALRPIRG